jgi:hypothetical protein
VAKTARYNAGMVGRQNNGRFAVGNAGGPGRPPKDVERGYWHALREAITDDDVREVAAALVQRAKAGDVTAARLIVEHTIGRPRQNVMIDSNTFVEGTLITPDMQVLAMDATIPDVPEEESP